MPVSRLRPFRYPALLLSTGLLLAVGLAMVSGIESLKRSSALVEHSYHVMNHLDAAQASLRAAEGSARGFRRTGLPALYADYLVEVPQVREHADELVALTSDNPGQHRRATAWRAAVRARLEELERLVDPEQTPGEAALAADVRRGGTRGTAMQADAIREVERRLLASRKAASNRRADLLTAFVVLGIVVPLLLLMALLAGLLRENRRARRLEQDARRAVDELQDSLFQRDRLSEQRRVLGNYAGLLQSCQTLDEAFALTSDTIEKLLPHAGACCYVLRASQNLAERVACCGTPPVPSADMLAPGDCWALRRGQPHRTDDRHGHLRCAHLDRDASLAGVWTLCVPLAAQGHSLGMLHVSAREGDGQADGDTEVIETIAEQLSLAMVNLQLRESLRVQSLRDPLTGLFNRRYLEENLGRELQRCARRGLPLSVLMIDIDHFKRFNDEHGHAAGDAMLSRVGQVLASLTRGEDIACRYGGEEFTIVLPEADLEAARQRAEEIREVIAATTVTHLRRSFGPATASIGVAGFPSAGDTPAQLLEVADAALYRAKAEGRNRVLVG